MKVVNLLRFLALCLLVAWAALIFRRHAGAVVLKTYGVHFEWTRPATREDKTPLLASDLAKYTIYWVCDTKRQGLRDINDPLAVSADLDDTWLGNCTFSMTATDTGGLQSKLSAPVTVLIKLDKPANGGFE